MNEITAPASKKFSADMVNSVSDKDFMNRRVKMSLLQDAMLQMPQLDIPVKHHFFGGMYGREIVIKKDTLLIGRIHKFDHFDIMLSGDITVSTDTGEGKRLTGLNIMKGAAGKQRAGIAHEDTHWITFHSAEERDHEDMFEFLTVGTFGELESFNSMVNREDYKIMIHSIGLSEKEIREVSENKKDQIDMPSGYENIFIDESRIEGQGVFSSSDIKSDKTISPSLINGMRTPVGRYANHAMHPNTKMVVICDGFIEMVSLRDIKAGEELTVNYRAVLQEKQKMGVLCQV